MYQNFIRTKAEMTSSELFQSQQDLQLSLQSNFLPPCLTEMEYCASAASMLAEEIWQIAEGFVEVPVNLLA